MIKVSKEKCVGCGLCIKSCAFKAIEIIDRKAVIDDKCTNCGACIESCPFDALSMDVAKATKDLSLYSGVMVVAEQREGILQNVSLELICEGQKLASDLGTKLYAVLMGNDIETLAKDLVRYGTDVIVVEDLRLKDYTTDAYTHVLTEIINSKKPEIVLIGASNIGRDLAPRVSARLKTGLTADCTVLEIDKENRRIMQTRPAFGGNIMATIICPNHRPQMATVRPGIMQKASVQEKTGNIEKLHISIPDDLIRTTVIERVKSLKEIVNLEESEVIVAGGRGVGSKEGFALLKELADELGGVVGASRAAVEAGWIGHDHQIGQTGKAVRPKLYIACGISGAIQHLAGMQSASCIVSINKSSDAPISQVADYSLIGDYKMIIRSIIDELKR